MSVFCITSRRSVGCTFFDWTIHFLSGQQNFYQADQQQWVPLNQDPVLTINAHGHPKNHPGGATNTLQQLDELLSLPQDHLYSSYPTPMRLVTAAEHFGIPIEFIGQPDNYKKITHYMFEDFNQIFKSCHEKRVPLIYVGEDPRVSLYHGNVRNLDLGLISTKALDSESSARNEFRQLFFSDSSKTWDQLGLTDIWDQREQQALNIRPFQPYPCNTDQMCYPHLWINCQDLWTNGEATALKMLKYLGLELDTQRLGPWRPVYAKWQAKQIKLLEFCYSYQHIVDSIVNNWYYEIDLTFEQEVVIQHCLIYQHNLNLKTWQLIKFPSNTQDLHKLLEPNTHPLGDY